MTQGYRLQRCVLLFPLFLHCPLLTFSLRLPESCEQRCGLRHSLTVAGRKGQRSCILGRNLDSSTCSMVQPRQAMS